MKLHAFLATAAELPRALRDGIDGFAGALLSGADPANLSSLFELVTRGALPTDEALADIDQPVAAGGPDGPWAYAVPAPVTAALAAASGFELDGWAREWAGPESSPGNPSSEIVRALGALAAKATPDQTLYILLDAPAGAKDLPPPRAGAGAKDLP